MEYVQRILVGVGLVVALGGCAGMHITKRAAVEFDCPRDEVETERISAGTFQAKGCGKKAIYACGETQCIRNSKITADE